MFPQSWSSNSKALVLSVNKIPVLESSVAIYYELTIIIIYSGSLVYNPHEVYFTSYYKYNLYYKFTECHAWRDQTPVPNVGPAEK